MQDKQILDRKFWEAKYEEGKTGWDLGDASKPLIEYVQTSVSNESKILIPGAGRAYELEFLWNLGFKNVYALDLAKHAKSDFHKRCPEIPENRYVLENFFEHNQTYDLVLEQTFFCALDPSFRASYAEKLHKMLHPNGRMAGVLFDFPLDSGPPFGGSLEEYQVLFKETFKIRKLERCRNSIPPRSGRELFVELEKK